MLRRIRGVDIKGNEILGDLSIDFFNKETKEPYKTVAFVGENGCGKTTLLNSLTKLDGYHYVFMRQNSMLVGMTNEALKYLSGKEEYTIQNKDDLTGGQNVYQLRINSAANNKTAAIELLKSLNDGDLIKMYENGEIDELRCGGKVIEAFAGQSGSDINVFSSGQQEILLKLKTLRQAQLATDIVLLDEPEASLHPRWQKKIVGLIRDMLTDKDGNCPQLFIATHSENILESLISEKDSLVVRLFRDNGIIKSETVSQMDLRLPKTTFAELDYVVFNVDSFEYCSQLYDLIEWKTGDGERLIDKRIRSNEFYNEKIHYKEWFNEKYQNVTSHNIATYCRNYFHHPKDREKPTLEQLHEAIELLRNVVLNLE